MVVRAANIGPKGRRRRALMGVLTLAAGIAALVVILLSGVGRGWRVALFVPFWAGARRDLDGGEDLVADPWMVTQLKRQAREIHVESVLLGAGLTGLALLIPG